MLPPTQEHSFHFFMFAPEGLQNGTQKLLKWRPGGSFGTKKIAGEMYSKHVQTNRQQVTERMTQTTQQWD